MDGVEAHYGFDVLKSGIHEIRTGTTMDVEVDETWADEELMSIDDFRLWWKLDWIILPGVIDSAVFDDQKPVVDLTMVSEQYAVAKYQELTGASYCVIIHSIE